MQHIALRTATRSMTGLLLAATLALALPPLTFAASFDCAEAATKIEHQICASPDISRLDGELSDAYRRAIAALGRSEIEVLKTSQRTWIRLERNTCQSDQCLVASYTSRINKLRLMMDPAADLLVVPAQPAHEVSDQKSSTKQAEVDRPTENVSTAPAEPTIEGIGNGQPLCGKEALEAERCVMFKDAERFARPIVDSLSVEKEASKNGVMKLLEVINDTDVPVAAMRMLCFGAMDRDSKSPPVDVRGFDVVFGDPTGNILRKYAIRNFKSFPIIGGSTGKNTISAEGTSWREVPRVRCVTQYVVLPSANEINHLRYELRKLSSRNGPAPVDTSDPVGELREKLGSMGPRCPPTVRSQTLDALAKISDLERYGQTDVAKNLARQQMQMLQSAGCVAR